MAKSLMIEYVLTGPLQNIILLTAIYSLLFHVDIFSFQAYLGYKICRCE